VKEFRFMAAWDLPGNMTCISISSGLKLMNSTSATLTIIAGVSRNFSDYRTEMELLFRIGA